MFVVFYIGFQQFEKQIFIGKDSFWFEFCLKLQASELQQVVIFVGVFEVSDEKKVVLLKFIDIVIMVGFNGNIVVVFNILLGMQFNVEDGCIFVCGGDVYEI